MNKDEIEKEVEAYGDKVLAEKWAEGIPGDLPEDARDTFLEAQFAHAGMEVLQYEMALRKKHAKVLLFSEKQSEAGRAIRPGRRNPYRGYILDRFAELERRHPRWWNDTIAERIRTEMLADDRIDDIHIPVADTICSWVREERKKARR